MLLVSLINNYHYYYYFTIPFIYLLTHLFLYLLPVLYCFTYIICHLYVFSYISYLLESFLNLSNYFFPDLLIYLFINCFGLADFSSLHYMILAYLKFPYKSSLYT